MAQVHVEPFRSPPIPTSNSAKDWIFAGHASSFPNVELPPASGSLFTPSSDNCGSKDPNNSSANLPVCRILSVSNSPGGPPALMTPSEAIESLEPISSQVLIFRYRGHFHAVDHGCPHRSYPLSRGRVDDIEDFGIALSAGITCPKHGWGFDLWTGMAEKGGYQLGIWEVEVRNQKGPNTPEEEREIWVRKKRRRVEG